MNIDAITPLLITLNEEANIARTLAALDWAKDIVVVDSGSKDGTVALCEGDRRIRLFRRAFDTFGRQCEFGRLETGIQSEWILTLDADHVVTPGLLEELKALDPPSDVDGYEARFIYCIAGKPLRGTLYPPRVVLFRRERGHFEDDGHGHKAVVAGGVRPLRGRILHDDRKPLSRWLEAQERYSDVEADRLATAPWASLSWPDRLRRLYVVTPWLVPTIALLRRGCILDGLPGFYYAGQRGYFEILLALKLLDHGFQHDAAGND